MNKGLDEFCARRRALARPALSAAAADRSGDRGAGAQRLARGPVPRRHRGRALGHWPSRQARDPDSQSVLRRLRGRRDRRRIASRSICRRPRATGFLPDLDALAGRAARAHGRVLSRLAGQSAGLGREPGLSSRGSSRWRAASASWCSATNATPKSTREQPPPGMLEAAGPDFANVVVFQSLSKRSNLPGLRIGFVAGDRKFPRAASSNCATSPRRRCRCRRRRSRSRPMRDEAHVEENRALYALKFDLADQIIGDRYGYRRPAGGFLLWLDVSAHGGDEAVALRLWREAGLRVIPGSYLAREQADGRNPGRGLHPRRHGAGQGNHRRGAASPGRGAGLEAETQRHVGDRTRPRQLSSFSSGLGCATASLSRRAARAAAGSALIAARDVAAGAGARHLVGAGPVAQPRHQRAGAQSARHARRGRRRSADAAVRPRRDRARAADRDLGLAAAHPSAARPRVAAPAVLARRRCAGRRACAACLPRSARLAAAGRPWRRDRRRAAPAADAGWSAAASAAGPRIVLADS